MIYKTVYVDMDANICIYTDLYIYIPFDFNKIIEIIL